MKKTIIRMAMLCLGMPVFGTALGQTYVKTETNTNAVENVNYSVCRSGDRYFTSGTMDNSTNGTLDLSVTCRSQTGTILWNKTFDFANQDQFSGKIRPVSNGDGVIIVGTTGGQGDNYKEIFALHLDKFGVVVSEAFYTPPSIPHGTPNTYGFDVVYEPDDETFVIVGMGVYPDINEDEYEQRFGWVFKVSYDLQTIQWNNRYTTDPGQKGSWYDCINNIERVENNDGIFYYLTGSVSDYNTPNNNFIQHQAVLNLLIDANGGVVWNLPFRNTDPDEFWLARQYDRGTNSLYHDGDSKFYLLYHMSWGHGNAIAEIDYATGAVLLNTWFAPFGSSEYIESNMEWADPNLNSVVIAGFVPTGSTYQTYLFSADPANLSSHIWQSYYPPTFTIASLMGINYDWSIKPMVNNANYMQRFFVPNMLVNNPTADANNPLRHVVSIAEPAGATTPLFHNLLIQTNPTGGIGGEPCSTTNNNYNYSDRDFYDVTPGSYENYDFTESDTPPTGNTPGRTVVTHCTDNWDQGKYTSVKSGSNKTGKLSLYPNPAADEINLVIPAKMNVSDITVTNILGSTQSVHVTRADGKMTIAIALLASGVYTIEVKTNNGSEHLKFIKE
jgi:hypothetical protein